MKNLFCSVVTDPSDALGSLESPIIFHVKAKSLLEVEAGVKQMLIDEYEYDTEAVESLDIFSFKVIESDIVEL